MYCFNERGKIKVGNLCPLDKMKFIGWLLFAVLVSLTKAADKQAFRAFFSESIIPDVIDSVPPHELHVEYSSLREDGSAETPEVKLGNVLTQTQTKEQPTRVVLDNPDPKKSYFLMMMDPDPPTKALPVLGEFLHWMVGNIPGNETNVADEGDTLVKYYPPGPPPLSGLHRFVFLVFEQPYPSMHFDKRDYPGGSLYSRLRFNHKKFARKYNLGKPVGANFYKTRYG